MRIVKHNIHKANTSCNFCNRGELNRNDGISYPYDEVYSFQRDEGSGLLAFACEDCLKELFTALPPHITCARQYMGEIDKLRAENEKYRKALEGLTEENNKLAAENHTQSEELGELKNITDGLDGRVINQQRDLLVAYRNKIALTPGITVEIIMTMLEDDIKTLRTMDGAEMVKNIIDPSNDKS